MKCCIILLVCLAAVVINAEPPNYRTRSSARQVTSPGTDVEPLVPRGNAPYPPSGWKPAGARFELPPMPRVSPEYLPAAEYGPPTTPAEEESTTTEAETTTVLEDATTVSEEEVTTPPSVAALGTTNAKLVINKDAEVLPQAEQKLNEQGAYYVLLPNSRLQRILYSVTSDPEKQQFSSQLQSVGTQSLSAPLIFYTPQYVQVL